MEIKAFRGLNNTTSPERFGPKGFLDAAENVDVDDTGKVLTRRAIELALAGSYHSLWADGDVCLVASGSDLYRLSTSYAATWLTRLLSSRRISFNRQQGTVYFSNGVDRGRIHQGAATGWGIAPPVGQPVAQPIGGGLPAGRYRYALTFRRADGSESGTGAAGLIELPASGGVAFSGIETSADSSVVDKCLYLSGPNGEELFRLAVLASSATSLSYYGNGMDLTVRLETQFDNPPPAGDIVECHNGVMYVVSGSVAWHSKPYQFERFCSRDQFMQFPGAVTMFTAVNDGIYVSTSEATWFLAGKGPGAFESHQVFDYGAIPGTAAKATVGALKGEGESEEGTPAGAAVFWTTPRGVCLGSDSGAAINITEREHSFPASQRGAGLVRQARGYTQYLSVLEGTQQAASNTYQ